MPANGFSGRVREITIPATAREMDSQFEWVAHEDVALKEGVPASVIDAIKHRNSNAGLDSTDALIIELVRRKSGRRGTGVGVRIATEQKLQHVSGR